MPSPDRNPSGGIVTLPSPHSFSETLRRLHAAISSRGLTLFADIDQQSAARSAGLTMPPAHLVLFGSPKSGTAIMLAVPEAGLDLPLKALVWEDATGSAYVTYNSPMYLASRYALPESLSGPLIGIVPLMASILEAPAGA